MGKALTYSRCRSLRGGVYGGCGNILAVQVSSVMLSLSSFGYSNWDYYIYYFICFVDRSSLYNLANETNFVHKFT